ncbi:protein of unknown function [Daejeonella rubra]|uniref:Bacteriocin-protection, YdeI or OmpD-Associated n=1 Tax=Daejeonella rubra TaxID=990371 RepID=A0A1G9QKD6_9SPHI|nr:DUF1905 domain-containing protein [Daejeonella rubra]SDM11494.1 protein of unknown function [Daejeonella rubra]
MDYIVKNEKLVIQHIPGNGAWTYQLIIPNTKDIKGKWGELKVSGTIDDYEIKHKNLGPMKNSDKKMALNSDIRKSINKSGGDVVSVTLFLEKQNKINDTDEILECFRDAEVLEIFDKIDKSEQKLILMNIKKVATEDQKTEKILKAIVKLEKLKT